MKRYEGRRTPDGCIVEVVDMGRRRPLELRLDLRDHSPTGFEWGYGGSGPAQLALALLADALNDDERALRLYQNFKWAIVGHLPRTDEPWAMELADIRAYADREDEP